eukprot:gene514-546_t
MQANEDSRKSYRYTASQSFPSGHSEWTMSSCFYISLVLWRDASKLQGQHPGIGKVIAFLGVLLLLIPLWVGCTRIQDYWHFPVDVATGWLLGVLIAAFCFVFLSHTPDTDLFALMTMKTATGGGGPGQPLAQSADADGSIDEDDRDGDVT